MTLPIVLEVALGLVFIYLVLSLLASEIQEILSALLQWRAEHLKRSIELLLAGQNDTQLKQAEALADSLYSHPLIRSLNQEGRGPIARIFRRLTHWIGQIYRWISQTRNTFGDQRSGPSYIPADTFATTLLGNLGLKALGNIVAQSRLQQFVNLQLRDPVRRVVADLRASVASESLLDAELQTLEASFDRVLRDVSQTGESLQHGLERLSQQMARFEQDIQHYLPEQKHVFDSVLARLDQIQRSLANGELERRSLLKQLEPQLSDLLAVLDQGSDFYQECIQILRQGQGTPAQLQQLQAVLRELDPKRLPPRLRDSLQRLAERAERNADALNQRLEQFETEVAKWFDRSMERTSGVYRRNARGISFLIGLAIAIIINADTFYITSRLAQEPAVRSLINQAIGETIVQEELATAQDLSEVRQTINQLVDETTLPLGRSESVLAQQEAAEANWPIWIPRRFLGWTITGLAISMGASFWFDLLNRFVRVRSTGKPRSDSPDSRNDSTSNRAV
jgi:hypothetical protein